MSLLVSPLLDRDDIQVVRQPFAFLVARDVLDASACERLLADFPRYRSAGFFPYQPQDCGASVQALVAELCASGFADAVGERLGIAGLAQYPVIVTLSDSINRRHGTIHTDSQSKIATALCYLNPEWPATSAGCLRFLTRGDDIGALAAPEIRPLYGTVVAFRRSGNSWHGHLPHAGERRVIQVAWLASAEDAARKQRRGRFSRMVKKLMGALDRHWGAGRDINAGHR